MSNQGGLNQRLHLIPILEEKIGALRSKLGFWVAIRKRGGGKGGGRLLR